MDHLASSLEHSWYRDYSRGHSISGSQGLSRRLPTRGALFVFHGTPFGTCSRSLGERIVSFDCEQVSREVQGTLHFWDIRWDWRHEFMSSIRAWDGPGPWELKVERGTCRECSNGTTSGERKRERDASMLMRSCKGPFSFEVEEPSEGEWERATLHSGTRWSVWNMEPDFVEWNTFSVCQRFVMGSFSPSLCSPPPPPLSWIEKSESEGDGKPKVSVTVQRIFNKFKTQDRSFSNGFLSQLPLFRPFFPLEHSWWNTRNEIIIEKVEPAFYEPSRFSWPPWWAGRQQRDNKMTIKRQ